MLLLDGTLKIGGSVFKYIALSGSTSLIKTFSFGELMWMYKFHRTAVAQMIAIEYLTYLKVFFVNNSFSLNILVILYNYLNCT